ncbi:hypothetical protein JCM17380_32260 [Desulfosporosinus burensis]
MLEEMNAELEESNAMLEEEITKRQKAEEEIKKLNEGLENKLMRWNKKHEEMTGYSSEELAHMNLLDWYKGDEKSQTAILEGIDMVNQNGYGNAEANLQKKDGTKIPMYLTASSVTIDNKLYFAGIGIDMTERNQLYERLQKYQVLAEKANDAMLFMDKEMLR